MPDHLVFRCRIQTLYERTGKIESSFSSKLTATRYPDKPVIDRFVLQNVGLSLPKSSEDNRLAKCAVNYDELVNKYVGMLKQPEHVKSIEDLRKKLTLAKTITNVNRRLTDWIAGWLESGFLERRGGRLQEDITIWKTRGEDNKAS